MLSNHVLEHNGCKRVIWLIRLDKNLIIFNWKFWVNEDLIIFNWKFWVNENIDFTIEHRKFWFYKNLNPVIVIFLRHRNIWCTRVLQ